jgi:hypothetical protein
MTSVFGLTDSRQLEASQRAGIFQPFFIDSLLADLFITARAGDARWVAFVAGKKAETAIVAFYFDAGRRSKRQKDPCAAKMRL